MLLLSLLACGSASALEGPTSQAPKGFWDHWGDGKGELAGYRLVQPRYGSQNPGRAVLITVTEDFLDGPRVKPDRPGPPANPVLKLNTAVDFQTGVYDYNVMSSVFLRLDGADPWGVPTKLSFSSQEWCGHVYDELITRGTRFERVVHSYFEGESGTREGDIPATGVYADTLPLLVRGLVGQPIAKGASRELKLFPRAMDLRFQHREGAFQRATLARAATPIEVQVPAGTFQVERYTLTSPAGTSTWDVDVTAPHHLVRWTGPDGEQAELTGVVRTPYWNQHAPGDERLLEQLGMEPVVR